MKGIVITIEEMKQYLRVSGDEEDVLIQQLLDTAGSLCKDVVRGEIIDERSEMRMAVMYATAYLYEHREEADYTELLRSLRALLMGERKALF